MKPLNLDRSAGVLNALSASRLGLRIAGGRPAAAGKWPWMTALFYRDCTPATCQFCGGALIRPGWVLTAAHCAAAVGPMNSVSVFLGSVSLAAPGEQIEVADIVVHEDFDPNTLDNDLALLRLSRASAQPTIRVIPAGDPRRLTAPGQQATIIGWGTTSEGGRPSPELLEVSVPIVAQEVAAAAYAALGSELTSNMVAAGVPEGGKDACQGDSGGPFMVPDGEGGWYLAGVTSWGIGCARPGLPGIYTRLSNYAEWIATHAR